MHDILYRAQLLCFKAEDGRLFKMSSSMQSQSYTKSLRMTNEDILDLDFNSDQDSKIQVEFQTVDQFIILSVATLGIYNIWWMYKAWKFFEQKDRLTIMPAARAIFSILFLHSLFERILKFAKSRGYEKSYSSTGLFVVFVVLSLCNRLPDLYSIIAVFSFLVFIQPIDAFNRGIELSTQYALKIRSGFSTRQIVLIVCGLFLWFLILLGLFYGEPEVEPYF